MKTNQVILVGALGLAAYFFFRSKLAEATTHTPVSGITPGGNVPNGLNYQSKYSISSKGLSYTDKNLNVAIPTGALKNAFSDMWTSFTKGNNKENTIQGTDARLIQETNTGVTS